MPEEYMATVPIDRVAIGEIISDWTFSARDERPTGKLLSKDVKTKYTYFEIEGWSRPFRFASDCEAMVIRTRDTPEERLAREKQYVLESMDADERAAEVRLQSARADVQKRMDEGKSVSHWEYGALMKAQAIADVWEDIRRIHVGVSHRLAFDGKVEVGGSLGRPDQTVVEFTRFDAMERLAERYRTELHSHARFTSRSTSLISNLVEDYEREARAEFLDQFFGPFGRFNRYS